MARRVRLSNYSKIKKYAIFHHNPDNKDNVMKEIEEEANLIAIIFWLQKKECL